MFVLENVLGLLHESEGQSGFQFVSKKIEECGYRMASFQVDLEMFHAASRRRIHKHVTCCRSQCHSVRFFDVGQKAKGSSHKVSWGGRG